MTTSSWFEETIDELVDGYVDGFDSNKLNDEQLVNDICEELETIFNVERIKQLVKNRLNEIKNKQPAPAVEHIHFTYTCTITNKPLFEEVKESNDRFNIYWFDELENDELKLCKEIVKHVEPDKVNENNNVHITFDENNDNEFYLTLFVIQLMDQQTNYNFIVKLIDEKNGIYDVEELVD